eukprot:CAMPEP_0206409442 /NCGR_PEP_ID=MMETSP0294-20121207/31860_1 /ASSEMBLY_ACC=CAM_ASM_000327 /TAXON_ID=39354 /ORGANISM="Heterosigma akashiwo, Strain CCMP2393" /LENGTH=60 /DNA_ID=CAMNT_0053869319 /DNA_START=42 /DNA_END=224 /DNA_ORIENTATION=+
MSRTTHASTNQSALAVCAASAREAASSSPRISRVSSNRLAKYVKEVCFFLCIERSCLQNK